jgi:hypothetical protein
MTASETVASANWATSPFLIADFEMRIQTRKRNPNPRCAVWESNPPSNNCGGFTDRLVSQDASGAKFHHISIRIGNPQFHGTGGSRTHTFRGLSSIALPVGVPCRQISIRNPKSDIRNGMSAPDGN